MVSSVMDEFHRLKSVEPVEKALSKGRFTRSVFKNLPQGSVKTVLLQEALNRIRQKLARSGVFRRIQERQLATQKPQVQERLQRVGADLLTLQVSADGFACPERNSVRHARRGEHSGIRQMREVAQRNDLVQKIKILTGLS